MKTFSVFFKIRYTLPGKRLAHIRMRCKNFYYATASNLQKPVGEFIQSAACETPGKRDRLQFTIQPLDFPELKNAVKIPCKLIWY